MTVSFAVDGQRAADRLASRSCASQLLVQGMAGRLDLWTGSESSSYMVHATQRSTAEATLIRAVSARHVVVGRYTANGDAGMRVFYPHVLYRSAAGELLVDVFQVDGPTRVGQLPGWRVLKVAGLRDLEILDAVFLPVPRVDLVSTDYRREILAQCVEPRVMEPADEDYDLP